MRRTLPAPTGASPFAAVDEEVERILSMIYEMSAEDAAYANRSQCSVSAIAFQILRNQPFIQPPIKA